MEDCSEREDFGSVIVVDIREIDYAFVEFVELWLQLMLFLFSCRKYDHIVSYLQTLSICYCTIEAYTMTQLKNF